jgi:hypothetical protein
MNQTKKVPDALKFSAISHETGWLETALGIPATDYCPE